MNFHHHSINRSDYLARRGRSPYLQPACWVLLPKAEGPRLWPMQASSEHVLVLKILQNTPWQVFLFQLMWLELMRHP